jgi:hypothetical protein
MTTWADHLYSFPALGIVDPLNLEEVFHRLVTQQREQWPALKDGMAAWAGAQRRRIVLDAASDCSVDLLCHPARYENVTVVPDIERRCPLCLESLPPEEMGIAVGSSFIALPNPAPIIKDHVVISHRKHVPQLLAPHLNRILTVLAESKGNVAILYNGPSSGASTPHHLHFQAGNAAELPLLRQIPRYRSRTMLRQKSCTVHVVECQARRFLFFTSRHVESLCSALLEVIVPHEGTQEIELNLVAWKQKAHIAAALFPRGAHRPSCFYRADADRLLISPGSMEMAGLIVVPRREDWGRLTADRMRQIFREVCFQDDAWHTLLAALEVTFG